MIHNKILPTYTEADTPGDPMTMDMLELLKGGMSSKHTQAMKAVAITQKPMYCVTCEDNIDTKHNDDFFTPKPSNDDFFKS